MTITCTLSGASATFAGGTDTITGTFTYDTSTLLVTSQRGKTCRFS